MCAKTYEISRQQQDDFSAESYRKLLQAQTDGHLKNEIVPVTVDNGRGAKTVVEQDDNAMKQPDLAKMRALRAAFQKDGTITAGNASSISDGSSAVVLVSGTHFKKFLQYRWPDAQVATIKAFNDAARQPEWFTTAPADAIKKTLAQCNLQMEDVDYFEINEAFSVVALANAKLLNMNMNRLNVFGGAVALGHPIGCSGCRIVSTLCNILKVKNARIGCASVCNGGGGASCVILEQKNCTLDPTRKISKF